VLAARPVSSSHDMAADLSSYGQELAAVSHGVLSKGVAPRIAQSRIKQLFITDTIEPQNDPLPANISIVSVSRLFAEAIQSIHDRTSVSQLFPEGPQPLQ
jgi:ribose-phosphate pyrophosphokinase